MADVGGPGRREVALTSGVEFDKLLREFGHGLVEKVLVDHGSEKAVATAIEMDAVV